jgi:hypothetical protein
MQYDDERFFLRVYRNDRREWENVRYYITKRFNVDITNKTSSNAQYILFVNEVAHDGVTLDKREVIFPWCSPQETVRIQFLAFNSEVIYKIQGLKIGDKESVSINFDLGVGKIYIDI